jgi:hypothetical protein
MQSAPTAERIKRKQSDERTGVRNRQYHDPNASHRMQCRRQARMRGCRHCWSSHMEEVTKANRRYQNELITGQSDQF